MSEINPTDLKTIRSDFLDTQRLRITQNAVMKNGIKKPLLMNVQLKIVVLTFQLMLIQIK